MIEYRIDHVALNVTDLEESIRFYERLFGFSVIEKWEDPGQAFVGQDSLVLGLMEYPEYDYSAYTKAHIAFPCKPELFDEVVAAIESLGVEILSGPKQQRGGETILFRDPSGNILEVCYPPLTNTDRGET